jgi:hypothetical protein
MRPHFVQAYATFLPNNFRIASLATEAPMLTLQPCILMVWFNETEQ